MPGWLHSAPSNFSFVLRIWARLRVLEEASFKGLHPLHPHPSSLHTQSSSFLQPRALEAAKPGSEEGRDWVQPRLGAKSAHRPQLAPRPNPEFKGRRESQGGY